MQRAPAAPGFRGAATAGAVGAPQPILPRHPDISASPDLARIRRPAEDGPRRLANARAAAARSRLAGVVCLAEEAAGALEERGPASPILGDGQLLGAILEFQQRA